MSILQLIYLMIPAYLANAIPMFVKKIPWKTPVDFGLSFRGKRVLGANKTWRGIVSGVIIAGIAGFVMSRIYWPAEFNAIQWSLLIGFGAMVGDSVKSFFKRQVGVKPGKSWIPFDQIDYTIGALVFGSLVFFPGWSLSIQIVLISAIGHVIVNLVGYHFGINSAKL